MWGGWPWNREVVGRGRAICLSAAVGPECPLPGLQTSGLENHGELLIAQKGHIKKKY